MRFIQRLRVNDITPDRGKQVEMGKSFLEYFGWLPGITYPIEIYYGNRVIKTSFKVRDCERGGDRIGVDCKEYSNYRGVCPLKDFFIYSMHFTRSDVGMVSFVLENMDTNGTKFKLSFI